ncbi:unnamed protein product, partial [marine sediment metagenome]
FDAWRKDNGASYWLYYLLHQVDVTDFDTHGSAPKTEEEELSVESTGTAVETWVREETLPGGMFATKEIWSSRQIAALFEVSEQTSKKTGHGPIARGLYSNGWGRYGQVRGTASGDRTEVLWLTPSGTIWQKKRPRDVLKRWQALHSAPGLDGVQGSSS